MRVFWSRAAQEGTLRADIVTRCVCVQRGIQYQGLPGVIRHRDFIILVILDI